MIGDAEARQEVARAEVQRICSLLLQLPLQWGALLEGVNPRTHLATLTGISKSRIAEGALDGLRLSTIKRASENSLRLFREHAVKAGWSSQEIDELLAGAPRLSDGLPSRLGWLFYLWSKTDGIALDETIRQAVELEEFVVLLHGVATAGPWIAARRSSLGFERSDARQMHGTEHHLTDWETVEGWQEAHRLLDRLLTDAYEDLFITLDVEWGAQYFASLKPQPVLLWLSPVVDMNLEGRMSRRNGVRRPVRRLFELTHVIAERWHSGRWPDGPPGRSDVAAILEQSDAEAGNYFDGTRKLTLRAFETWWLRLTAQMRGRYNVDGQMMPPRMLARVALLWQGNWVKTDAGKLRSVILLDQASYRRRW